MGQAPPPFVPVPPLAVAPYSSREEGSWAADPTQYEDCLLIQMSILLHVCLLFVRCNVRLFITSIPSDIILS